MINLLKVLIFVFFTQTAVAKDIEHFLMPEDRNLAQDSILKSIKNSKKSIDVAMFMFTNKKIANAIIVKSSKNNSKIRVVVDKSYNDEINPRASKIKTLEKAKNIQLFLAQGLPKKNKKKGIMHAKLIIIDDETVFLGSTNLTNSAFSSNYEILIKINDRTTAKLYKLYFDQILNQSEIISR